MESLQALLFEEHDGLLFRGDCLVLAELSHPPSCSARQVSARATLLGGHALVVVEGLTVQMQRVHVELLESFRSAVISDALDRFRSALGLTPLVVVADGLDDDERVAGRTDCPDAARILEAWYDEHDLRNRSMGAGGRQFFRVPF